MTDLLPFRVTDCYSFASLRSDWLALITAYKEAAKDPFTVPELWAELLAAVSTNGAVFAALDTDRKLCAYM